MKVIKEILKKNVKELDLNIKDIKDLWFNSLPASCLKCNNAIVRVISIWVHNEIVDLCSNCLLDLIKE